MKPFISRCILNHTVDKSKIITRAMRKWWSVLSKVNDFITLFLNISWWHPLAMYCAKIFFLHIDFPTFVFTFFGKKFSLLNTEDHFANIIPMSMVKSNQIHQHNLEECLLTYLVVIHKIIYQYYLNKSCNFLWLKYKREWSFESTCSRLKKFPLSLFESKLCQNLMDNF